MIVICVYRAPYGNFDIFMNKLEIILNSLYRHNTEFILCGNININYLEPSHRKNQLDNLLGTFNRTDTVTFPTRITKDSVSLDDNIFIDNRRSYTIQSCPSGLSDQNGQNLTLLNIPITPKWAKLFNAIKFDNNSVTNFQTQLSYEQWENVFGSNDANEIFNNFLNTYLRCYYSCFNKITTKNHLEKNQWITTGIKTSCKRKTELFQQSRISNDTNLKTYYKRYCKILSNVIQSAKKLHYNRIILNSKNKITTTWKIITMKMGKAINGTMLLHYG